MSETPEKPRDERFAKIFADLSGIHNSQEGWPTGDSQMALRQIHGELNRWRSVAEQLAKMKPTHPKHCICVSCKNWDEALAAFDSLRKEKGL